jgi:head-tail adaptor
MPNIKAGKMRHRLNVIEWTEAQNAYGEEVRTDEVLRSFNGQLIPISSKEIIQGGQVQGMATHRLICRANLAQPLKHVYKLSYQGRTFQMDSIIDIDEIGHKLVCLLTEEVL